jgi:hypothetical protein
MSIDANDLVGAVAIGIGASLLMVFPLFVLQPSLGLGVASARTPRPARARLKSLATHTVFGAGLYVCGLGVSCAPRVHV